MSNIPTTSQNSTPQTEIEHITEELYKKNFELAQKNKILSLLRAIDVVILSAVIDTVTVAQKMSDTIVHGVPFIKLISIFLYNKSDNGFHHLATSESLNSKATFEVEFKDVLGRMGETSNLITKAFSTRKMCVTNDIMEIYAPFFSEENVRRVQSDFGIKSFLIYPISIREEMFGSMVIGTEDDQNTLSYYQVDLIDRLPGIVGIAIDNCMLYKELQDANEKLKALDKLKDEFFSLASHELRTPLTAIRGNAALIKQFYESKILDKKFSEMIDDIHVGSVRLIEIVNDFLNVSRLEQGKIEFKKQPLFLLEPVNKALSDMKSLASDKGVELVSEVGPDVKVIVDFDRLLQILYNLVGNAIKFTENGRITVTAPVVHDFVKVSVIDTGIGISFEKQGLLFQKFQQAGENSLTREVSRGSGLGLYISKLLVEGMGGKIFLEKSELTKGSTFSFTLPIAK